MRLFPTNLSFSDVGSRPEYLPNIIIAELSIRCFNSRFVFFRYQYLLMWIEVALELNHTTYFQFLSFQWQLYVNVLFHPPNSGRHNRTGSLMLHTTVCSNIEIWSANYYSTKQQNINPSRLCNGSRLVKKLMNNIIEVTIILNGWFKGRDVLLPRIAMILTDAYAFRLLNYMTRIFIFSMTIN
ncbi:Uncharacterized protein FWK35_00034773, partial [Aphis craccivora]